MAKNKPTPLSKSEVRDGIVWAMSAKATKDGRGKSVRKGLKQLKDFFKNATPKS